MMHKAVEMSENLTDRLETHFNISDGPVNSYVANSSEDQISSVKKNNSVINSSVMFSVGFLSNILALIVLNRSPADQRRKLFYRLVAGLTVTDLVGTTATSPVVMAVYNNDFKWIGGTPLCKYFGFMMIFSGTATTTIICLMAIERLLCIRHPYLYYAHLRKKHATYFLLGGWIFAGLMASLPLFGFGTITLQYPYTWCFFDYYTNDVVDRGFNYLFAITALLTISVTVTCNGVVLYTLFRTKMRGLSRQNNQESRTFSGYSRRYAECQMAVLLIGITVVFSRCYLPLIIRIVINQTKLLPVNLRTDLLMIRLASLNQILDPWVYILLRREVVWLVVNTIKKLCSKQSKECEVNKFSRQDSAVLTSEVHYTCCAFCWHCLCDPPQTQRRSSSSFYSDYGRYSIYSGQSSPTNKFALHVMNSVVISDSKENNSNSSQSLRRSQIIKELQRQASVDTEVKVISGQTTITVCLLLEENGGCHSRDRICSAQPLLESTQEEYDSSADCSS